MIKILFMIHDLGEGGAEKVLVNLVNNMDSTKFDITVLSLFAGGVNEQFLKKTIRYQTIFSKAFPGNSHIMKLLTPKQLHRLFVKEKYDIEVSYLEGPTARIISGCPNKATKLVSWIHVEQHSKELSSKAFRSYEESEQCYKCFQKIVCVSQSVKEDFMKIYPKVMEPIVLYNTNETDQILKMKDEPVEDQYFRDGEIRLCGVGKIMPNKGFDKLARIHKQLKDEGYPVHTYILGKGPEQEKIQQYITEKHLEKTFTFLGYQTNPYKYVAKCDIFVCTSIAEGFSTAATEALIVGTPVVTTPVAGMKEMLGENDEYGIITGHDEEILTKSIKKLLDDKEMLDAYRIKSRLRGEAFSTKSTVSSVEDMLSSVCVCG